MIKLLLLSLLSCTACFAQSVTIPQIPYSPEHYVCYKTHEPVTIDGIPDEPQWNKVNWTNMFTDISGGSKTAPRFLTRARMLWDENYFYVAAEMEEPHIWATLRNRDDRIYNDNCFEVFIDPDGDTRNYCELEINALNTVWDLLLTGTYRDVRKPAVSGWDIKGLKTSVSIKGSLNNPDDKDTGWTAEIAIPWKALRELTSASVPPHNNDQWRINLMRVEWESMNDGSTYRKRVNPDDGSPRTDYWCWSPQGLVSMHYPEMWGFVQFSEKSVGTGEDKFIRNAEDEARWFLRRLYYAEKNYYGKNLKYTSDPEVLELNDQIIPGYITPAVIECTSSMFEASVTTNDRTGRISIDHNGIIRSSNTHKQQQTSDQ